MSGLKKHLLTISSTLILINTIGATGQYIGLKRIEREQGKPIAIYQATQTLVGVDLLTECIVTALGGAGAKASAAYYLYQSAE